MAGWQHSTAPQRSSETRRERDDGAEAEAEDETRAESEMRGDQLSSVQGKRSGAACECDATDYSYSSHILSLCLPRQSGGRAASEIVRQHGLGQTEGERTGRDGMGRDGTGRTERAVLAIGGMPLPAGNLVSSPFAPSGLSSSPGLPLPTQPVASPPRSSEDSTSTPEVRVGGGRGVIPRLRSLSRGPGGLGGPGGGGGGGGGGVGGVGFV